MRADLNKAFMKFTDPSGCLCPDPDPKGPPGCDNTMLFTAEKLIAVGETRPGEAKWFRDHIMSCMTKDRGFIRHPKLRNPSSFDDLVGAFAFLKTYGYIQEAKLLYAFMDKRGWKNHDNWLGRFPHLLAFAAICCNQDPGPFGTFAMAGAFELNKHEPKKETSGKCMLYLMAKVIGDGHGKIYTGIVNGWKDHIFKMYGPTGMKAVFKIYFNKPGHPLPLYAKPF